jgi:beta-glucanase (GH16 family)
MVLAGYDGGTRVEATYAKQTYGQFQVRGRIPCGSGVISAFYVSIAGCIADSKNQT